MRDIISTNFPARIFSISRRCGGATSSHRGRFTRANIRRNERTVMQTAPHNRTHYRPSSRRRNVIGDKFIFPIDPRHDRGGDQQIVKRRPDLRWAPGRAACAGQCLPIIGRLSVAANCRWWPVKLPVDRGSD